jgi:glycine/D-amino acid oxidase-like deaminating enzyme
LWTAYELRRADPSLDVVVLEAQTAGFGASGRNGGWVLGQLAGTREHWARRARREGVLVI